MISFLHINIPKVFFRLENDQISFHTLRLPRNPLYSSIFRIQPQLHASKAAKIASFILIFCAYIPAISTSILSET